MDPLRLGFRSIVGITMPGAIVMLSVLYGLWATCQLPNEGSSALLTTLFALAFFIISYAVGNVLGLRATAHADRLSGRLTYGARTKASDQNQLRRYLLGLGDENEAWEWFSQVRETILLGEEPTVFLRNELPEAKWSPRSSGDLLNLWKCEDFPYPCWSLVRLGLCCPESIFKFYWPFREQILAQVSKSPQFFNFCKIAVCRGDGSNPNLLSLEIQQAEGLVRFLAGAFDAFVISSASLLAFAIHSEWPAIWPAWTLVPLVMAYLVVAPSGRGEGWSDKGSLIVCVFLFFGLSTSAGLFMPILFHGSHLFGEAFKEWQSRSLDLTIVAFVEVLLALGIVAQGRLRTRRHSEVAAVMDSFYLQCKGLDDLKT